MKKCPRCEETKPLGSFNVDKSRKDGRHPYCTACKTAPYKKPGYWERYRAKYAGRTEKRCTSCGETKVLSEFYPYKKSVDGRSSRCALCLRKDRKKYYDPQKAREHAAQYYQRVKDSGRAGRDRRKAEIISRLGGCCSDCGLRPNTKWPVACFDFHHDDPSVKDTRVSKLLISEHLKDQAWKEAKKCIVLCANCHRRRHSLSDS